MAARDSWAVQASGPTGLLDVEESRVALGAVWMPGASGIVARSGFRPGPGTSPGLVTPTGTPDANVHVAPFQLVLQTGRAAIGGPYIITLDAIANVNVLSTPADPTNPRNDLIIAQQSDTFYGDGVSTWQIRQVVGTPSGSPADPAVSGSGDYVPLARVRVNASVTTITGAVITDLRTTGHAKSLTGGLSTVGLGGILPVATKAERDALSLFPGLIVARLDVGGINLYDGAAWHYFGRPTTATVATTQSTASVPYVDLTTPGPAVTVETDTAVKVTVTAGLYNTGTNATYAGFAVSGATTRAALDAETIQTGSTAGVRASVTAYVTGLTAGSNTFTMKYRVDGGTGNFYARTIMVEPL
jgi:hypothetical protein